MTQHPGAGLGAKLMNKGHMNMVRHGRDDPGDQTGLGIRYRFGGGLYLGFLGAGHHIRPQSGKTVRQGGGGELSELPEGMNLQPQQQGFLRQDILQSVRYIVESFLKILEIGAEGAPVLLCPDFIRLPAQTGQQLGIVAGMAELDSIEFAYLIEIHEFVVGLHPGVITERRNHPQNSAGNSGGIEVPEHGYPFIALLNVKITQIFVAKNGFPNAHIAQMIPAEGIPLLGKFGFGAKQRAEGGGKGGDPAGGFGAYDPGCGNVDHAQILYGVSSLFAQNIVQHGRMGLPAGRQKLFIFFFAAIQRGGVFFSCNLKIHGNLRILRNFTHISYPVFCRFARPKARRNNMKCGCNNL